jgi:hypothetical protein
MANPKLTNASGLTNSTFSPTSELQESYNDLRQFLALRSNDELLLASDRGAIPSAQINDDQANTSIAISTLMSPDGAFLTKDMPTLLDQMQISPFNGETGQISINGATNKKFGQNLFDALGLNVTDFELSNKKTKQQNLAQIDQISESIGTLNIEIKKNISENSTIQERIHLIAFSLNSQNTFSASLNSLNNTKKVTLEEHKKFTTELMKNSFSKIENAKFEFNVTDIEIGKHKFYKIKIEGYNKSNNKLVLTQIYYNCFINEYLFGALINYNDENEGKMLEENFMNSFEK